MALARWPTSLPQTYLLAGYSETEANSVISSEMEYGPQKRRRRTTAAVRTAEGTMLMTPEQFVAFRAFLNDNIGGGALPFEFPDHMNAGQYWLTRINVQDLRYSRRGLHWEIAMKLEILP